MRRLIWTLINAIALCLLLLTSCSKDDESPVYDFKDQALAGAIEGVSWSYGDGYASTTGEGATAKLHVTLVLPSEDEGCDIMPDGDRVFFTLPSNTGVHLLKFDFNDLEGSRTVTLFDDEEVMNVIATEGAVEITSITETHITGRIDARADEDNFVNGNFSVPLCN